MSLSDFYRKQCTDKLKENIATALLKLSDPSSLVQTNIGDLLASGSEGGLGGLAPFAQDYLAQNGPGLVLAALKATGLENSALDALNLFYNMLAQLMAAYNDMILIFLKSQATRCVTELDTKISLETDLKQKLVSIVNTLGSLDKGDPTYDAYLAQLRLALIQLNSGRNDLLLTRNTFKASSQFLPKVYRRGRNNIRAAVKKIKPPTDSTKVIVPTSGAIGAVERGGIINRGQPATLLSSLDTNDTKFGSVRVGDTVTITIQTGSNFILPGVYKVSQKLSSRALVLDHSPYNTAKQGVDQVTGVTYYIETIVKGVGTAVASALIKDLGIPTSAAQIENMMATPTLIKGCIGVMRNYITHTLSINTLLTLYKNGLDALLQGMPDLMKGYVLNLFDPVLNNLATLIRSMALTLNNDENRIPTPVPGFKPQVLNVASHAFKWSVDGNLIVEAMKLIPASVEVVHLRKDGVVNASDPRNLVFAQVTDGARFTKVKAGDNVEVTGGAFATLGSYTVIKKVSPTVLQLDRPITGGKTSNNIEYTIETDGALGEFQLNQNLINVYRQSVISLKKLNNAGSAGATLIATEGEENVLLFSGQVLTFLTQAASSIVTSSEARKATMSVGRSLIARCDLAIQRDKLEQQILRTFINTPIPLEDTLNQLLASLKSLLAGLGLDKAADALASGDYAKLFGMNAKNATYIGAAVEAIAFLKSCFDDDQTKAKLTAAENDLKGQKDLFSLKLSFDFDLAILKNIKDCINLNNLADLFASKEAICQFIKDATENPGKAYNKLEALVTGGDASGQSV